MKRFGEKLRMLREHYGLSYRQLAAELEVAHGHLAGIESGATRPSVDLILRIAAYFEVSLDDLMLDERNLRLK